MSASRPWSGKELSTLEDLLALSPVSFELFTADVPDDFLFDSLDAVTETLRRLAEFETMIGISPGDQSILAGSAGRDTAGDIAAFLASRPPLAEANGIARAVLAAATTGARIHIRQVNSALGVETWRRLQGHGRCQPSKPRRNASFSPATTTRLAWRQRSRDRRRCAARTMSTALRRCGVAGPDRYRGDGSCAAQPGRKVGVYGAFADIPGGMPGLQTLAGRYAGARGARG